LAWPGDPVSRPVDDGMTRRVDPRRKTTAYYKARKVVLLPDPLFCELCGYLIDKRLRYPEPGSASVDHIIPLSRGGDPADRSNMRPAHLGCNSRRGSGRYEPFSDDWFLYEEDP
jgi:5-methylcytosine-specific restriction endonuclease McrA